MRNTTPNADKRNAAGTGEPSWMERLMAITQVERGLTGSNPKLRREIRFQAMALLLGPTALAYAIYKVAISLLGYTPFSAALLAAVAAFSLFAIDRHQLIQARRNPSDDVRRSMYKVRAISILIMSLSFAWMTTDTFRADIDRILVESWQARRAELVQSPRYRAEIDAARTEATKEERAREGNVNERMATAKQQLATIDQRIDQETGLVFGGRMQRIEAMVTLLQNSPSARVVVTFWLLIGALPNLLMLAAQFRCLTTTSSLRSWPPNKPRSWQR